MLTQLLFRTHAFPSLQLALLVQLTVLVMGRRYFLRFVSPGEAGGQEPGVPSATRQHRALLQFLCTLCFFSTFAPRKQSRRAAGHKPSSLPGPLGSHCSGPGRGQSAILCCRELARVTPDPFFPRGLSLPLLQELFEGPWQSHT